MMHTAAVWVLLAAASGLALPVTAAPDVSGTWTGATQCPLGRVMFKVDIQGTSGTINHSGYDPARQKSEHIPVQLRFMRGHQGEWVYLENRQQQKYFNGLLSGDGRKLQMSRIGDCVPLVLIRTGSPPAPDTASAGTAPGEIGPSQAQMRAAIERGRASRAGGGQGPNKELRLENGVSGMSVQIHNFEKLGCERARGRPGYVCDYSITQGMQMYAPDRTAAGSAHADAVNKMMEVLTGGVSRSAKTNGSARFVQTRGGWQVLRD